MGHMIPIRHIGHIGHMVLAAALTTSALTAAENTLTGKVMCGYQGWFSAEGDSVGMRWMRPALPVSSHIGGEFFRVQTKADDPLLL